ncbi:MULTISPECIES: flagellar FlbD family protein [Nocardia]|uniref:flagellar FlbD family protein n=1 Tax=Nocardia TaxID=1817 RepID=UPI0007A51788|nr:MULTISPECIES: flagellar FlbD family protein [Nocardia]
MLQFHEVGGSDIFVNPDTIATVSAWGDSTVLSLTDGTRRVVTEPLNAVLGLINERAGHVEYRYSLNVVDVDEALRKCRRLQASGHLG